MVLLPNTALADASVVAERLRRFVAEQEMGPNGDSFRMTASFGVAPIALDAPNGLDVALRVADAALYRAKAEGRNRVVPSP